MSLNVSLSVYPPPGPPHDVAPGVMSDFCHRMAVASASGLPGIWLSLHLHDSKVWLVSTWHPVEFVESSSERRSLVLRELSCPALLHISRPSRFSAILVAGPSFCFAASTAMFACPSVAPLQAYVRQHLQLFFLLFASQARSRVSLSDMIA